MKQIVFAGIFSLLVLGSFAQDMKSTQKAIEKADWAAARTAVEAWLAKSPASPEGLYYKAKIYTAIASNDQLKATLPNARAEAFAAFKTAIATGDKSKEYLLVQIKEGNNFYKPIFDLYSAYYDDAAAKFNVAAQAQNKDEFRNAYNLFTSANEVGQYISSNKWALSDLDTGLVLNIGKAALNAGMNAEAVAQFTKLADAKVTGTANEKQGYSLPYQWLTLYYKQQKDDANMNKYATLGKQLYPTDDYYDAVMLDYYRDKKDKEAMWKTYKALTTSFPDSLSYHFNYANDLFNHIYNAEEGAKITDREELLQIINSELTKAMAISPDDVNSNWLYGQYYYNQGVDLRDKAKTFKGTKPEDVKSKAEFTAKATESFNKAIPYADKALTRLETTMKKSDKSRYKSIVDLNQRIYQNLQKPDKVKIYEAKYDGADALFVK